MKQECKILGLLRVVFGKYTVKSYKFAGHVVVRDGSSFVAIFLRLWGEVFCFDHKGWAYDRVVEYIRIISLGVWGIDGGEKRVWKLWEPKFALSISI